MTGSRSTWNPIGGVEPRRSVAKPSLPDDLMERVLERANMQRAWKRVKANRGSPGVDGMTVDAFPAFVRSHWPRVRQALLDGTYQPSPVRRVSIPKPKGRGVRLLGIPTVLDRVIGQAIQQVLTPIFDPEFLESSFGFRPRRSAHGALRQVQRHVREGYRIAVDLDLERFFDRVDHDALMSRVARKVRDKRLLASIGRFLRAGVLAGDLTEESALGTPQGSPLSPLLANVLLDDLVPGNQAPLVRGSLRRLPVSHPPPDGAKLGYLDGRAVCSAQPLRARLDELLRHLGLLPARAGPRPLDPEAHPHVLLETVAPHAHQGQEPPGLGDGKTRGDLDGHESQRLLASVEDARHADRDDEPVACKPRAHQCS